MLNGWPEGGVWLSTHPTDMRNSFGGLSSLVKNQLRDDPQSGRWYVFINRRRTILKILAFEAGGYYDQLSSSGQSTFTPPEATLCAETPVLE